MSMSFTEALIRVAKHRASGHDVDFKAVVGDVAMMEAKFVTDDDVNQHLADAVLAVADVKPSTASLRLRDILVGAMAVEELRGRAVAMLAHTYVSELRRLGLWSDSNG